MSNETNNSRNDERVECQICGRMMKRTKRGLSSHGYMRPGLGYQMASCAGSKHAPYPATDVLVKYEVSISEYRDTRTARLNALRSRCVERVSVQVRMDRGRDYDSRKRFIEMTRDEYAQHVANNMRGELHGCSYRIPASTTAIFDDMIVRELQSVERDIAHCDNELDRISHRIEMAETVNA